MKKSHSNCLEIARRGGAIASGDWVSGAGRYISKRPIPEFCVELSASSAEGLRGRSRKAALRLLRQRPRVQKIIAVANWRAVGKLLKKVDSNAKIE